MKNEPTKAIRITTTIATDTVKELFDELVEDVEVDVDAELVDEAVVEDWAVGEAAIAKSDKPGDVALR